MVIPTVVAVIVFIAIFVSLVDSKNSIGDLWAFVLPFLVAAVPSMALWIVWVALTC